MLVSILHRVTGAGLALAGGLVLVWWLCSAAEGAEAYSAFRGWATHWTGIVVAIGLSWALFQHMLTGIRHFALDIGAGYELTTNKFWSVMTLVGSVALTAALWAYILRDQWL